MNQPIAPHVLHIARTACLVESRAHLYSSYLAVVFRSRGPQWVAAFEQWGAEEETHGQRLRAWLAEHDPHFDFEGRFSEYLARVPYHAVGDGSVYGSHQGELVARCFVEAMAASYYQALGGGAEALAPLCRRLAADEARHFTMFRRLLEQVRREEGARPLEALAVMARRALALDDEQILSASWLAGGASTPFVRADESRRYRAMMWKLYRPEHLRFVATLCLHTLGAPVPASRLRGAARWTHRVLRRALA